jgi:hypothetical protein
MTSNPSEERMLNRHNAMFRSSPLLAGALVGLANVTPAAAATLEVFNLPVASPTQDLLLLGSLALLSAALAMRIYRRHHTDEPMPDGPDLRWWKNS